MYSESLELTKFRAELVAGGFSEGEAFQIVMTYFEVKLDTRANEDGIVYLVNGQVDLDGPSDG